MLNLKPLVMFCSILMIISCGSNDDSSTSQSPSPESSPALIFSESFEEDLEAAAAAGSNGSHYLMFQRFTVVEGSVDLLESRFSIDCPDGDACVDLDGSHSGNDPASIFSSENMTIEPGEYQLTFFMGGNQRVGTGGCESADSVEVSVAPYFEGNTLTFNASDPILQHEMSFTADSEGQANIAFSQLGLADKCGAILDNIELRRL